MRRAVIFILLIVLAISIPVILFFNRDISGRITDYSCSPRFKCDDWSGCVDGIQSRICKDVKCGNEDIIERRLCNQECKSDIKCNDWSGCIYLEEFNDIAREEVSFLGYRERICYDVNRCTNSFDEFEDCKDSYPVKFSLRETCGKNYLAGIDSSGKLVAFIDADGWKNDEKLIITFTQDEGGYCPSCYNGVRDENEEGIDCGGSCKKCSEDRDFNYLYVKGSVWAVFIASFVALLVAFRRNYRVQ